MGTLDQYARGIKHPDEDPVCPLTRITQKGLIAGSLTAIKNTGLSPINVDFEVEYANNANSLVGVADSDGVLLGVVAIDGTDIVDADIFEIVPGISIEAKFAGTDEAGKKPLDRHYVPANGDSSTVPIARAILAPGEALQFKVSIVANIAEYTINTNITCSKVTF
jgi:hypothetical protein